MSKHISKMVITVKQTSDAKIPMEILQHIFSYTQNVVFRPFTNTNTNTNEIKWRMWVISQLSNSDPRYRMICAIPPRLKLYYSTTIYDNPNGQELDWWYYSVIFRNVPNNKRFNITCMRDSSIDAPYIIWTCFEKFAEETDEPETYTQQQYKMTNIRLHQIR